MSASNKKTKNQMPMTERQRQEAKEAKTLKAYTLTFCVVVVLCLAILVGSVAINPIKNVVYKNTKAITIGNETLSAVELNYFYIDAISQYVSTYSSYISYILNVSAPLDEQIANKETNQTWADYFLEIAIENATSTYELYRLAQENNFSLSDEEKKSIDSTMLTMDFYATYYNYGSTDAYLVGTYGNGATAESYREYYEICATADAYYAHYSESLEYDAEALQAYDKEKNGQFDSFTYNYYLFSAATFREGGTKDDKGVTTYTDEEKKAAIEVAKKLAEELAAGTYEDVEAFDKALNEILKAYEDSKKTQTSAEETAPSTTPADPTTPSTPSDDEDDDKEDDEEEDKNKKSSTKADDVLGSKTNSLFQEWLFEADRAEGDLKVFEYSTGTDENKVINGYYVVRYEAKNDNNYALVNVRHLLVAFEGGTTNSSTGEKTYSEAEKKKAKEEAEKLLAEWEAGAKTEESFSELANKNSDDQGGKVTNGGLYEDIVPGEMVTAFNDWCFDAERKIGDYDIVETEYGYHIMYFSSFSETLYREYMLTEALRSEDTTKWHTALVDAAKVTMLTDKYVNKGLKLS